MDIKKKYDVLIIGGGISACVFASNYIKNNKLVKIAIIEAGRGLGGRSSTRKSSRFNGWKINHGAPNFNISNTKKNKLLQNFIEDLLKNKIIKLDDSDQVLLTKNSVCESIRNSEFMVGKKYISSNSMSELSQNIISLNNLRNQIDFYFGTLIVNLNFKDDAWELTSRDGAIFKSKYLVCSSSLPLHKRSIDILNSDQIPLRKAIPINKDKKIDLILNILDKQISIPRYVFMIYTKNNYQYKDLYRKKNRYFYLAKDLKDKYKLERVIFQIQENNKLGIAMHTNNADLMEEYIEEKQIDKYKLKILNKFNELFADNALINQLEGDEEVSIMKWRASQPSGCSVPLNLQYSSKYRIGLCGDWFENEGFGRVEGAILSALNLANEFNSLN